MAVCDGNVVDVCFLSALGSSVMAESEDWEKRCEGLRRKKVWNNCQGQRKGEQMERR